MIETYKAQAYVLGERFLLCLYYPDLDMRFPLYVRQPTSWRMLNWCILQTTDAAVAYALVLARPSIEGPEEPGDIAVETQFGTVAIAIGDPQPFAACDAGVQAAVLSAFLGSLANEGVDAIIDSVSVVRSALERLDRATFERASQSADGRAALSLSGLVAGIHVVSLEEDPVRSRLITDLRFDWAEGDRTEMILDQPLPPGRALVLGDGGYFPVLVNE